MINALLACIGIVAYAASVLFDHAYESMNLSKDNYVKTQRTGVSASGSIKPGDSISCNPVAHESRIGEYCRVLGTYDSSCERKSYV